MPLRRGERGPNRRTMTHQQRAELAAERQRARRAELLAAADDAEAGRVALGRALDRSTAEEGNPPPVPYVQAAAAAAHLAAVLAEERNAEQRERIAAAAEALGEAMAVVERYHSSAGFWEARTQIKRWIDAAGEVVEERAYGPYYYRRYLDPEGREQVEYHGKDLPPDAPAPEDMRHTSSTRTLPALIL